MTTTTSIKEIQERLESRSTTEFIQLIIDGRKQRLTSFKSILETLSTNIKESDQSAPSVLAALAKTLDHLRDQIDSEEYGTLSDDYIVAVYQLAGSFNATATIEQHEDRFHSLENDSIPLKAIKTGKRLTRSAGKAGNKLANFFRRGFDKPEKQYEPWTQQIPLRRVIEYHLFTRAELPKWWINEDERLLLKIISELEGFLVEAFPTESGGSAVENLKGLVNILTEQVNRALESLEADLEEDRQAIKNLLLHHFEKAGTIEKRLSYYRRGRIERAKSKASQQLSDHMAQWQEVQHSLLDKTKVISGFLDFSGELQTKSRTFSEALTEYFDYTLFDSIEKIQQELRNAQSALQKMEHASSKKDKTSYLTSVHDQLDGPLQDLHDSLSTSLVKGELRGKAERFSEQALLLANDVAENVVFVHDLEFKKSPPTFEAKTIEWRLMVVRVLKEQLLSKIKPSEQHYDEFLQQQIEEIREIQEVIAVNLDSALELLETKEKENPIEIAREALERSELKLEHCLEAVEKKHSKLREIVLEETKTFNKRLLQLLHTGDPGELQVLDAKYRVKETAQSWKTKLGARWARLQDSATLLGRFSLRKIKKYSSSTSDLLGFEQDKAKVGKKTDVANYLTETDAKIGELPYIYRRLFNFDAESDRRFYVALNENFLNLNKAYESWKSGFAATVSVVGEKGSGKSTYLNFALDEVVPNPKVNRITLTDTCWTRDGIITLMGEQLNLENATSVEDVIAALKKKKTKIIVVESLQNLYLRNLHGYEALETLLYIISETKESVFWIISCSSYAWNFLQKTTSLADYFSHTIRSDNLTDEQIKSVIMKRHEASGYELVFEPGESQQKNRAYRKLMDKEVEAQQYLRETYFEELAEISEGNASIAMIFWLRSIRAYSDTHFHMKPLEVTSLDLVEDLTPDILFTLAALVLHDTLTPEQLSLILQYNEQESRLILTRLKTRGLLKESGNNYTLNHLMYRQVVNVLKQRNIIHLY